MHVGGDLDSDSGVDLLVRVQAWAAWAPGLQSPAAWHAWATRAGGPLPVGEGVPALAQVAPMARRRLDPLGRIALQAAYDALGDAADPMPTLFVSRRGDAQRSWELLRALIAGEGMSPTAFGLSVHNALPAQLSMARGDRSAYSALAAGAEGVENALVEAAGWLADGAPSVLLVVFEGSVPAPFQGFRDEPDPLFAWAWRLAPADTPGRALRLRGQASAAAAVVDRPPAVLPAALQPLREFLRDAREWCSGADGIHWRWSLDG